MCRCGVGALARVLLALQQPLGVLRHEPAPVFRDSDGNHFVFCFIDCLQNRRRRKQRHFMLAAASAKKNANPKFCHALSVWLAACFPSIPALVPSFGSGRDSRASRQRRTAEIAEFAEFLDFPPVSACGEEGRAEGSQTVERKNLRSFLLSVLCALCGQGLAPFPIRVA